MNKAAPWFVNVRWQTGNLTGIFGAVIDEMAGDAFSTVSQVIESLICARSFGTKVLTKIVFTFDANGQLRPVTLDWHIRDE